MNRGARIAALIRVSLVGCLLAFLCAATSANEVTYDLRVERGHVPASMRLIRVKQGDTVRLRWSSDQAMILHLHGYDIERRVEPGAGTEMQFTAHATGRFPVSVHKPTQGGGHTHDPPLVHVEVHPR